MRGEVRHYYYYFGRGLCDMCQLFHVQEETHSNVAYFHSLTICHLYFHFLIIIIITLFQSSKSSVTRYNKRVNCVKRGQSLGYSTASQALVSLILSDTSHTKLFFLSIIRLKFIHTAHHHFNKIKDQSLKHTYSSSYIQSFYTCTERFSIL